VVANLTLNLAGAVYVIGALPGCRSGEFFSPSPASRCDINRHREKVIARIMPKRSGIFIAFSVSGW
jgi:hypothetical protein